MLVRLMRGAALAAVAFPLMAFPAISAGDGGGSGDTTQQCKAGEVWDKSQNKCVQAKSGIDDDSLYEAGRDLALAGRYDEAIKVLTLASDKSDPRILNYLGYSHRKAGRVTVGLGYYQEALRQNPDYTLAREYMGEAYLQKGDLASARAQLSEIEKRAGRDSKEYAELARQIEDFRKG